MNQKMPYSNEMSISKTSYGNVFLEFDCSKISLEIGADASFQGAFNMRSENGEEIIGYVYAHGSRMQVSKEMFRGKDLQVPFLFDPTGLTNGDRISGEFNVVTNIGEYHLPYEFVIKGTTMESDLGPIRNLFHFANLAHENWDQAKKCFVDPLFADILTGSGRQYEESYKAILQYGIESGKMDLAMERFLILIHKKQPVSLICSNASFAFTEVNLPKELNVEIQRIGWGYTDAVIVAKGGIANGRFELSNGDFSQNKTTITLSFNRDDLQPGDNITRLYMEGEGEAICEIVVSASKDKSVLPTSKWQERMLRAGIMRAYLDYRTGRRPLKDCFSYAADLLERTRGMEQLLPALYEAHLQLLQGRGNEAIWLLKNAKRMLQEHDAPLDVYGYFLYLLAMSEDDLQKKATDLLDQYSKDHEDVFELFWACMHKDSLHTENPLAAYRRLKWFYEAGCNSPVLYMEAALLLLNNPILFENITDFEIQVFVFMDRYALVTKELSELVYHVPYAARKGNRIFLRFCKKYPSDDEALTAKMMCRLYMNLDCMTVEAAHWYKKGIQTDCRINGLYEAYVRALQFNQKEVIPVEVVRYFAYESTIEDRYLAYIYEKILKQQESVSPDYLERIQDFTKKQLLKGKINASLAYLYRNVLTIEDMNAEMQQRFQKLVFANELVVDGNLLAKSCIVRQKGLRDQKQYPIKNNRAIIYLYTDQYTILFLDEHGDLLVNEDAFKVRSLLDYKNMQRLLSGCDSLFAGEELYLFDKKPIHYNETESEFDADFKKYAWLLSQDCLDARYKKNLISDLLYAFEKWNMHTGAESMLQKMSADNFDKKERERYVGTLVAFGLYEKAYHVIETYGFEQIPVWTLLAICREWLQTIDYAYDEKLLKLCYYVYSNHKYTDHILAYLNLHFMGTIKQLTSIFRAAESMEVPAMELAQRILEQVVFVGDYNSDRVDIFRYYCENGGREELIDVYLSIRADAYLVSGREMEADVWELLKRRLLLGKWISQGAQLAALKHYSLQVDDLEKEECDMCIRFIAQCLGEDIYMSFFKEYEKIYPILEIYNEAFYVEYHAKPGADISIHYMVGNEKAADRTYYTEEMEEIYPGIYQKMFHVFWGESIPYYITQDIEGDKHFCEQGNLEQVEMSEKSGNGRFRMINEIAMAMDLTDYRSADVLIEQYETKKFLTEHLLKIK